MQKGFRDGGAFEALIKACHAHADGLTAPLIAAIGAGDKDVLLKDKAFQHHGYTYVGGDFIRSGASGQEKLDNDADVHATS